MKTTRIIIAENAFGYPVSVTSYNNKTRNGIMLFYADYRAVMRIVREVAKQSCTSKLLMGLDYDSRTKCYCLSCQARKLVKGKRK